MRSSFHSVFRLALLGTAALLPAAVFAQAPVAPVDESAGEEEITEESGNLIVVTAQKIEQRALDVPITISAVTGERIAELGVTDLDELSNYVPGLNIQEQSANNPGIVIRGITSDSGSAQQGPRVTLYYNGVDISRSRGSYQAIYDLERVEVIKGPQATLFGTASAVGAISLVSAKPQPGASAALTGGTGNFDATLLSGFVNAGSDVVAGRVAFEWRRRDGYVENLASSQREDLYAKNQFGVRGSLRFTPTSDITVDLIGTYDQQRHGGTPFVSGTFPAYAGAPGGAENAFGDANLGGSPFSAEALGGDQLGLEREVYDVNLTADWAFAPGWSFTTVNGYRKFDSDEIFDADGSAAPFLEFAEISQGDQFSHEGRFTYASDRLRGSFGWNVFSEDGIQNVPFSTEEGAFIQCLTTVFGAPAVPGVPCVAPDGSSPATQLTSAISGGAIDALPYASVFENQGQNDSYSVFADVTFIPTDALELTAGVRYLWEDRWSGFRADVPVPVLPGLLPEGLRNQLFTALPSLRVSLIPGQTDTGGEVVTGEDSFDAWLPRFNALYRISPDVNVFATISKGRRSPVVQVNAGGANRIAEETVWNYEGGVKLASGLLSGSLGVYYQKYENFQVSVEDPDNLGSFITASAGSASNLGVEAEIAVQATDWLSLFGNVGYIDGGIDEDGAFSPDFSGARFRLQPEWQAAAGFTVDAPIGNGARLFATPSVTHRSRIFFEVPNDPLISQGPVTLVNARAGISIDEDRFEIAGFIRNAFDEDYLLDAGNTGGSFRIPTFIPAEPRLFGIEVTARFGG
ncbi:TonB-dependent receptor [Alteriqipengyuania lutimaris]|uniref:TonB-dependent receptor n=1 Tax=Alteriqipengyuania lutimaris TaxID=1538146 RepID=A0A395LHQ1_9SPHN|nr:TonB-dependent receptor [Alteriqipengyuania lutimaris]MBB3035005.1 outer membrane receptor protein involved in Fe transport [Alteriqipengyuania lutimaris]RDS76181.1 TonB-dependent receptor [Alteriqipengyuania lutimaris]